MRSRCGISSIGEAIREWLLVSVPEHTQSERERERLRWGRMALGAVCVVRAAEKMVGHEIRVACTCTHRRYLTKRLTLCGIADNRNECLMPSQIDGFIIATFGLRLYVLSCAASIATCRSAVRIVSNRFERASPKSDPAQFIQITRMQCKRRTK